MGLALRDANRYTYGDYRTWTDDKRWELIDGFAYAMAPAPTRVHQLVVGEVFRQIANQLQAQRCRPFVAPFDVRLPRANEADAAIDTVVQPDITVVCDPAKLDERGCRGAPDWVIEVLSPATADHDHRVKRALYERVGVLEYWLIHPTDRVVHVYLAEQGAYGKPAVFDFSGSIPALAVSGILVDLAMVAAVLD
jgi:Uma2 family endonuclease